MAASEHFLVGEDSKAWSYFVELVNEISSTLAQCQSQEEQMVLVSVIKDMEIIEKMKSENDILAIADYLIGDVSTKLRDYVEVN